MMPNAQPSPRPPLDHALYLARLGYRVLPIKPGGKHPPISAWQDAATTDPDTIQSWWNGLYRNHGVGIATGHMADGTKFFVLDVDQSDTKDGAEELANLVAQNGPLPETITSHTGSGGLHYILKVPPGVECPRNDQSGHLAPGLDIRGEGGQIVVAPTIHPNGRPYIWEIGHGPGEIAMGEAPWWLVGLLEAPARVSPRHPTVTTRAKPAATDLFVVAVDDGPAQRYNDAHTWDELLTGDSWVLSHTSTDGEQHWVRPGKDKRGGTSATVGYAGNDALKVFTSSVPTLQADRAYSRFGYYAATRHDGDRSTAARSILGEERGTPPPVTLVYEAAPAEEVWPEPIAVGESTGRTPLFPVEVLPTWIRDHAEQVAKELQVAVDLPATLALATLSIINSGRYQVHVRNTWYEHVNLYLVVALPPGAGKSPAFNAMLGVIRRHDSAQIEAGREQVEHVAQKRRMIEKNMKRAEDKGDHTEAARYLFDLQATPAVVIPRLIADDATPEALIDLMAQQGGRLALISTEGGPFELMGGRYSDKANLDAYLKAWGGDSIRIDRIGRGATAIDHPTLTVGLTVQPDVIRALADRPEFAGRGLTARFMYSVPVDLVGQRNLVDIPDTDPAIAATYESHVRTMLTRTEQTAGITHIEMEPDAVLEFLTWRQTLEERRKVDGDLRPLSEWTTKLESSVIRLAGLLALADNAAIVDLKTTQRALHVGWYWLNHAKAVHDMWGTDDKVRQARIVLAWLAQHGTEEFPVRDLYRALNKHFPTAEDTRPVLALLTERGWIRPLFDGPLVLGKRGSDSPRFAVHPRNLTDMTDKAVDNHPHVSHVSHVTKAISETLSSSISTDTPRRPPPDMTDMTDNSPTDAELDFKPGDHPW